MKSIKASSAINNVAAASSSLYASNLKERGKETQNNRERRPDPPGGENIFQVREASLLCFSYLLYFLLESELLTRASVPAKIRRYIRNKLACNSLEILNSMENLRQFARN